MTLDPLFAPRAVAVLGVSRNPVKLGYRLLQNVLERGYRGRVYPVNPSGEPILGVASVDRIDALPEDIDLALVSLPASAVPDAIAALAARHVRAAVVLSSGFGEVDDHGRDTQADLIRSARAAGLRLVGPNCMGVYSAPADLNGTYFWDLPRADGGISVVSQSGAYGGLIFRHLGGRGLGIARFLSIGNQADVELAEVLDYLAGDPATTLVACFIEAVRDGRRFVESARALAATKPLVVLKGGRSDAGRRAAGSHTGSLAGAHDVFRAACRRADAFVAEETEEFFDAIEALVITGGRRPARATVAVVTVSGGPSVVAADAAEREGLIVPALRENVGAALRRLLPPFAAVGNPVDLTPQVDAANIGAAVRLVAELPDIGGLIAVDVGLDFPDFADAVVSVAHAKPAVAFVADAPNVAERLRAGGVPVIASPERAVRAWRALTAPRAPTPPSPPRIALPPDVVDGLGRATGPLPYNLARRALEAAGVRFCRESIADSIDAAVAAATQIGYPVVLKADAPGLSHKSDADAVRLGVRDDDAVREACRELFGSLRARRILIQEQVRGVEVLVGARRDPTFGPVVAVGTGGIFTEVFRDVSVRLAPLGEVEAAEMLTEGARPRLLAGPRGFPVVEPAAVARTIVAVSALIAAEPRIVEIDVNPVIAAGTDIVAVDALVILA